MTADYSELQRMIAQVRGRWRLLMALRSWALGAAAATVVVLLAWTTQQIFAPEGRTLIVLWGAAAVAALVPLGWSVLASRRAPDNSHVARYIEECCPDLDDTLATAIAEGDSATASPMLDIVVQDAARRVRDIDPRRMVSRVRMRRASVQAAAATVALVVMSGLSAGPATRAAHLLAFYMFPERLGLEILPGDARIPAGRPLRIEARISGAADGMVPVLRVRRGDEVRDVAMNRGEDRFTTVFDRVDQGFRYTVAIAGRQSREYDVTVLQPPHVERIDLRYEYPSAFGLQPRTEEDGGDIYGPAGTKVHMSVHTDKPVATAGLTIVGHSPMSLQGRGDSLEGDITIAEDGSYRIALTDGDGISNPGDTEYFIRTLSDRPPDVRIVRPVGDREVTPLEEVAIEARADDDFGISALDLVYSVRGASEKVVPFQRDGSGTTVTGQRTVYLEDLQVQPGDFVTYYARVRDVSRGKRSTEARSDIFFLEVKPFDAEFVAAQSQANSGSGSEQAVEDLITGQKDVIAATWKLDRRGRDAGGRSQGDIRAVARAQGDLRSRAQAAANQVRRAGGDPGRRGRGAAQAGGASDDPMTKAVEAMGRAEQQLDGLKTAAALPHEMAALNELMRAQAEVRRREVQRQQANGGGRGSNRQQQDLSSLFDRELARQQQTNYETPNSKETRDEGSSGEDALDKIKELARRQEALNREQQDLAKNRQSVSEEEFKRQLERLTREESELRQQAEELSRQMQQQGSQSPGKQGQTSRSGGQSSEQMRSLREASEEMRNAARELRRQDPSQASASGSRALERLRETEQRMRGAQPDDRRRALGELQLESQQLAEEQRRFASQGGQSGSGKEDTARRRSAEQERLADRMQRLEQSIRDLANSARGGDSSQREALAEASRDAERQRLSERMRNAARVERDSPQQERGGQAGSPTDAPRPEGQSAAGKEEQEIAKGIERLSTRLGSANQQTDESRKVADRLSRVRELRDKLNEVDRQLSELSREGDERSPSGRKQDSSGSPESQAGRSAGKGQSQGPQPDGSRSGQAAGNGATSWQETLQLLQELQQEQGLGTRQPDIKGFQPGLSAPGTEAWKQDFAKWEELKSQLASALEKAETTAAGQLRDQQSKDRLNAGSTQAVPEQYRQLVNKYYRALASKPKEQ